MNKRFVLRSFNTFNTCIQVKERLAKIMTKGSLWTTPTSEDIQSQTIAMSFTGNQPNHFHLSKQSRIPNTNYPTMMSTHPGKRNINGYSFLPIGSPSKPLSPWNGTSNGHQVSPWQQFTGSSGPWPYHSTTSYSTMTNQASVIGQRHSMGNSRSPFSPLTPRQVRGHRSPLNGLYSRSVCTTTNLTQGLQGMSLSERPIDGTVVGDSGILGISGNLTELSNSLYTEKNNQPKLSNLESSLLDIIKSPSTECSDNLTAFRAQLQRKSYNQDQTVPSLGSSLNTSPKSEDLLERYSRKVFVGGLPPDIDEVEIHASFCKFGNLTVDWPHKAESKSYFPPKGYAFLLFLEEISVQRLIESCIEQDGKLYLCVSSPTIKDKPVQIRPWSLADADFVMDASQVLDPRKTIFVGGVPRPLRAVELALIMDRLYGGVCYSGIDVDPELKYPKGAGRVAFSNQQSYIAAISARFVQLQHGDIDKRVEVKPYVLDDQMCDECHGICCGGKFAPFFCANVTCLQYYCEHCWSLIHSRPGREYHKPLVKEGADRPRSLPYRW
ncbi:cytoplasmic polyadenylation element-binding protein 4-like isoform X2 [Xenia sp. Carnegie-2017]|uniref:cytoplasmic polyadenylation element-binding protein 4-like isoform X2 n=1 Tax=Xenia sp. Carnegie-2017 TaxID=2897299 RepID=UPI001F04A83E|nr:cytoplasmic polyadenylation element-binding protein 4-like isoform X2 [Xenia sp. Carnegie-2017]